MSEDESEIVVLHANKKSETKMRWDEEVAQPSPWRFKRYVRLGKTCFVSKPGSGKWASMLPIGCKGVSEFMLREVVKGRVGEFYAFNDEWLEKVGAGKKEGLSEDSWPDFLELDMLRPLRTTS